MMASLAGGGAVKDRKRRVRSDSLANRERIMQAAARLFADRGVDVPLDEIAEASGLGSATLHRHFQGRADLVHAVLDAEAARLAASAGHLPPGRDPAQALRAWLSDLIRFSMSYRGLAVLLAARDADTTLEARHEALTRACRQLLGAAQAGGRVSTAIDAATLLRLAHGIAVAAAGSADTASLLADVLMDGLQTRSADGWTATAPGPPASASERGDTQSPETATLNERP
jgi:AcrR family transcriptional regulator